jgi:nitrate/TMAO reductase-like tetraheme cytochrome c subunit
VCHDDATSKYDRGVHARARRVDPGSPAAACVDCHTPHEIKSASDPTSTTYKLNLVATCARCHGDPAIISRGIEAGNVPAAFHDSIHGRALEKAGLIVAPSCGDCHRTHDILPKSDPESPIHRTKVPSTCGTCHAGVRTAFSGSVHGAALARGMPSAPACQTCHTAHAIQRTEREGWQLEAVEECGTCHAEALRTYRDTFHGQVEALGFTRIAKCADCHTPHDIHPTEDPRSSVSQAKLVATCSTCHPAASANFVKYDPHADKRDRARSPQVYYAAQLMNVLLAGVFTFFGLHTTLWFWRAYRDRKHPPPEEERQGDDDRDVGA